MTDCYIRLIGGYAFQADYYAGPVLFPDAYELLASELGHFEALFGQKRPASFQAFGEAHGQLYSVFTENIYHCSCPKS